MHFSTFLFILVFIIIALFYFIGSVYVIKKHDGFRIFYNGLNKLLDYKGRASRLEYACICLLTMSLSIIFDALLSLLDNPPEFLLGVMDGLFILVTLSVRARRLHDLGYSGWLQTPIILIDMYSYSSEKFSYGGGITLAFIMVGFDLFLMFKEGQNTANKYGEKPNTLATS